MKKTLLLAVRGVVFLCAVGLFNAKVTAAPDFKIRYNAKFPCLEVMDSKAAKITDISEGTKGLLS